MTAHVGHDSAAGEEDFESVCGRVTAASPTGVGRDVTRTPVAC